MLITAEYIWLDGCSPTKMLRSKTRVLDHKGNGDTKIDDFPEWGFDGSSTYQAPGEKSDLVLKPVSFIKDPLRKEGSFLIMCEVFDEAGEVHWSNSRAQLRNILDQGGSAEQPWIGFEQEYTFFADGRPLGWPRNGFPPPQGPFYCGVGADRIYGREIVEEHLQLCIDSGLMIYGLNAEVMPAQWEFQVGFRGFDGEPADPLRVSDHLYFARWLMLRLAEEHSVIVSFDNKPIKGDWNGAGAHTNFSTRSMRDSKTGWPTIEKFISSLEVNHAKHVRSYGAGLAERLTGKHETCDINTFRFGSRDRGASIRIPHSVAQNKCGYVEDRRPGANCDPYIVSTLLLTTFLESLGHKKFSAVSKEHALVDAVSVD